MRFTRRFCTWITDGAVGAFAFRLEAVTRSAIALWHTEGFLLPPIFVSKRSLGFLVRASLGSGDRPKLFPIAPV